MADKHDKDQIQADKTAIDEGRCPETGQSLEGLNIEAHVAHVFPLYPERVNPNSDYARRARLLLDYGKRLADKPARADR